MHLHGKTKHFYTKKVGEDKYNYSSFEQLTSALHKQNLQFCKSGLVQLLHHYPATTKEPTLIYFCVHNR